MDEICFLILHYKSRTDTFRCIESILQLEEAEKCRILVLDNGSCNGSYEKLVESYGNNPHILLFKWKKGQGFSGGNNFLYCEAKKLSPAFIVATNNDIVFFQRDFCVNLKSIYAKNSFDILGPDIYIPETEFHQNPLVPCFPGIEYLEAEVEEQRKIKKHIYRYVFKEWVISVEKSIIARLPLNLQKGYKKARKLVKPGRHDDSFKRDYKIVQNNCILCGACLIFSPDFIEKSQKLFEPETDFYYEEYLLGIRCKKAHMLMRYDPSIKVEHNHGASTRYAYKGMLKRRIFITDNMIKSGELLLSVLKEDKNIWNQNH